MSLGHESGQGQAACGPNILSQTQGMITIDSTLGMSGAIMNGVPGMSNGVGNGMHGTTMNGMHGTTINRLFDRPSNSSMMNPQTGFSTNLGLGGGHPGPPGGPLGGGSHPGPGVPLGGGHHAAPPLLALGERGQPPNFPTPGMSHLISQRERIESLVGGPDPSFFQYIMPQIAQKETETKEPPTGKLLKSQRKQYTLFVLLTVFLVLLVLFC